jgi:predicted nucleic acid-binding Zn ribbon protein
MKSYKPKRIGHSRPQTISPVIDSVISNLGLKKRYSGWQIVNQWPEIVGDKIAEAAQAQRYEDGILFVKVKNAAWRQELSMQTDNLLEAIHKLPHGKFVKQIRLA